MLYEDEKNSWINLNTLDAHLMSTGRKILALAAVLSLTACASSRPAVTSDIHDPYEDANRNVHAFNLALDRNIVRPLSRGYGTAIPEGGRQVVSNVAEHLGLPADILNNVLQGDLRNAGNNTARFVVNTVFGVFGTGDMATGMGIPLRKTDFGETFHVWGAGEGAYVELPVFGPSTSRDTVGTVLDFALDPVSIVLPRPESYVGTAATFADQLGNRYDFADAVDSVLYESADSYAQARILYLQNRRFELGVTVEASDVDPFSDPFADPFAQ